MVTELKQSFDQLCKRILQFVHRHVYSPIYSSIVIGYRSKIQSFIYLKCNQCCCCQPHQSSKRMNCSSFELFTWCVCVWLDCGLDFMISFEWNSSSHNASGVWHNERLHSFLNISTTKKREREKTSAQTTHFQSIEKIIQGKKKFGSRLHRGDAPILIFFFHIKSSDTHRSKVSARSNH